MEKIEFTLSLYKHVSQLDLNNQWHDKYNKAYSLYFHSFVETFNQIADECRKYGKFYQEGDYFLISTDKKANYCKIDCREITNMITKNDKDYGEALSTGLVMGVFVERIRCHD